MPDMLALAVAVGVDNAFAGTSYGTAHDGDTCHVSVVDPLLGVPVILAVRLLGINANELSDPGGPEARDALRSLLPLGTVVTLRAVRPDKYAGRILAHLTTAAGVDVSAWMIEHGYAAPWNGVGARPTVPWPPA